MNQANPTRELVNRCLGVLRARAPAAAPKLLVILGSGIGGAASVVKERHTIEYADLPGFPVATVTSHHGRLILGTCEGLEVAVMQGRFHQYEGHPPSVWLAPIRTLRALGCDTLLVTNAAGSLRAEVAPPTLMLITDHINGSGTNPLVGSNDDEVGLRFPDMTDTYTPELQEVLRQAARANATPLAEGVYWGTLGPTFETPAEVSMMAQLGATAVGMSTVPEVIVARHAGMRVAGISAITNFTAGIADLGQTMEEVIEGGAHLQHQLSDLIAALSRHLARP